MDHLLSDFGPLSEWFQPLPDAWPCAPIEQRLLSLPNRQSAPLRLCLVPDAVAQPPPVMQGAARPDPCLAESQNRKPLLQTRPTLEAVASLHRYPCNPTRSNKERT